MTPSPRVIREFMGGGAVKKGASEGMQETPGGLGGAGRGFRGAQEGGFERRTQGGGGKGGQKGGVMAGA